MRLQQLRFEGEWWLPQTPDRTIKGTLQITDDGRPGLQLLGRLWDVDHLGEKYEAATVHGQTTGGLRVTVTGCRERTISIGHGRKPSRSSLSSEAAFVGAHFASLNDVRFTGMVLRYTYLDTWAHPANSPSIENDYSSHRVVIAWDIPSISEPAVFDGITVQMHFTMPYERMEREGVTVSQYSYIEMRADEERPYGEFAKLIRRIGNFLSLGVSGGVQPFDISGFSPLAHAEDLDGREYDVPVEIFHSDYHSPRPEKDILEWQMLFSLPKIASEWAAMLNNWLASAEKLEPVLNVYFATLQSPTYIEHRFISLAQALESYHRTVYSGSYMDGKTFKKTVYKQIVANLPAGIGTDLRESILDRIRHAYEYVLRKRLRELLETNKIAVEKNIEDAERFVDEVVATRNYLTHLGEPKDNVSATPDSMNDLADYLQFVMEICLLREIGLTPDRIRTILDKDYRYNHRQRWARFRIVSNDEPQATDR